MAIISIPFPGSKRNRVRELLDIMEKGGYTRMVEPFGGSCVIGVNLERKGYECVCNDYDRFFDNFADKIAAKRHVVGELLAAGIEKHPTRTLTPRQRDFLKELVTPYPPDVRQFLASNFMFSSRRTEYKGEDVNGFRYFFNSIDFERDEAYSKAIEALTLASMDYRDFITRYVKTNDPKTLVVLDPPYLNSTQKGYKNGVFFGLAESVQLLKRMKSLRNDFVWFNQIEKDIKVILDLLDLDYTIKTKNTTMGGSGQKRQDVLAYVQTEGGGKNGKSESDHRYAKEIH